MQDNYRSITGSLRDASWTSETAWSMLEAITGMSFESWKADCPRMLLLYCPASMSSLESSSCILNLTRINVSLFVVGCLLTKPTQSRHCVVLLLRTT
ncbi:hypothetical protein BT96DRAFT_604985 [Gymnopus androsaceus JB14]|uniref:Uncharacterized protein n=1 Tax=Gymnopus androsaceus JB14 TaxID=1447944 RepID=A0A6A4GIL4_9AGAR|nr:hypothetical protein BT96DRAFT_604985 [Gymnopus androsaceus JB14]